MKPGRRGLIVLAAVAVALVSLRLALPAIIESYVNSNVARMGPYSGHVEDIDVALLRGAYTLNDFTIVKDDAGRAAPFLELPAMDISVHWRALLSGELVGEIVATAPKLNLVQAENDEQSQLGSGVNWPDQVRELFPFKFNRVTIVDGEATFLAPGIESSESLSVSAIRLELENLTNIDESHAETTAAIDLRGRFMNDADLALTGRLNPNEDAPTFDIDFSLEGTDVTSANPWLREFLNVDAESGRFSMYLEAAAADGRFDGYLKPIMEDLEIFERESEAEGPFRKAWEALVDLGAKIFENRAEDQVATRVPYSGEFSDPDMDMLAAIVNLVRNAFVSALSQSLEGTVELEDVIEQDTD